MCNFWSCIVTKNGEVLFDEMSDRHEDIIEKYKLVDDTADPALLKFARVEINPPNGDVFAHINDWVFKIDQSIIPTWFTKENEKSCYKKLKYFTKKAILIGKEIKEISSGRFWVKDCKIVETKGTALICEMRGTSKVGVFSKNSIFYCKENAIAIIYFEQSPKIIVANKNIKIEYQKDAQ